MDCSRARTHDPSEWLETCPDFSAPLAQQLCDWILTWEPDLTESIKWNMLCFSGRKLVCGLSACRFNPHIPNMLGSTGDSPVPPGYQPGGMGRVSGCEPVPDCGLGVLPVPLGESPSGTGW